MNRKKKRTVAAALLFFRRLLKDQQGQIFVIAGVLLPVLLGAGAIAVDVGYMYVVRSAMQNAADAGAFAGASGLATGGQAQATAQATNFANQNIQTNGFLRGAVPTVAFPGANTVQVTVSNPAVPLFFAGAIGINTANINANATAQIAGAASVPPGLVPLAIYCNNPAGCAGVLAVGQNWTLRRYCGNYFSDGPGGNSCGNAIANGENFLMGITFDESSNSNSLFRQRVYEGYDIEVSMGQAARALPGNRNGWRNGMENRLAEGRNEMTFAVIQELSPATNNYNVQVVDFVQVRVSSFQRQGNTDQTTFEIISTVVSGAQFANPGQGLGINSVVGVRLSG